MFEELQERLRHLLGRRFANDSGGGGGSDGGGGGDDGGGTPETD